MESQHAPPPPPPPPPPAPREPEAAAPEPAPEEPKKKHSFWRELPVLVVIAFVVALLIKTFLLQAFYIPSASMEPTLNINDRVLVNKLSYDLHEVNRGDLIVFESPPNEGSGHKDLIKRVIALPGETVESRDGRIVVDGQELDEPYLEPHIQTGAIDKVTIPPDHYWVMGDNRANSRDSRYFGAISESLIIGRAFVRVWPVTALGLL